MSATIDVDATVGLDCVAYMGASGALFAAINDEANIIGCVIEDSEDSDTQLADASTRKSKFVKNVPTLTNLNATLEVQYAHSDSQLNILRNAAINRTILPFWLTTGDDCGWLFDAYVTGGGGRRPLTETAKNTYTLALAPTSREPVYVKDGTLPTGAEGWS